MKPVAIFATLSFNILVKVINSQHNGLVYNENIETNTPALQQQPIHTYAMVNTVPELLNNNGNAVQLPNNINQHQILVQTNTPILSPSTPQIQLPPDLQQQPLQVQQYLQLQKPFQSQQPVTLQQALQLQPQMQSQVPLQQHPLQIQIDTQPPLIPIQLQDILQLQPESQSPHLVSYQPVQTLQPLQSQTPQTLNLHQTLQSFDTLQTPHPMQLQQLGFQQISPQNSLIIPDSKKLAEIPCAQPKNNIQPDSQIQVKWKSSNPQSALNVEQLNNAQNINIQPLQQSTNQPLQLIANVQKPLEKPQDVPPLTYYVLPQQPTPLPVSSALPPVVSNRPSITTIPCNYVRPTDETYAPVLAPCSYVTPISEIHVSIPEIIKSGNSIPPSPSILALPNLPTETSNIHYYNPQTTDFTPNTYFNQNQGFNYPQQSQVLVTTLQSKPSALPSQSSVLPSVPVSIVQANSVSPQYGVSTGYPVNTIVAPAYTTQRSTSSNLKSILPIIFKLLKEKITSCDCRNDCSCECKNNSKDNDLELASGYSSQKDYIFFDSNGFSVLNTVSEEVEGPECIRETKNCDKTKTITSEASSETIEEEEEDSDEEEIEEEEED